MNNFDKTQNVCRICLEENNEDIQCVFDTISTTGIPLKFSEMLMICAKVEIILGDELPDQICSTCAQNTIKLYLFKIKCEESDTTLRNRLKEGSFMVIDKIEIDEGDILDKLKSEVKKENLEASSSNVLKDSGGDKHSDQQNDNHLLDTIVYEDYDVYCASPKYSKSLNSFNNCIATCETSQDNDVLHRKKVAEIAHQIKIIEHNLDRKKKETNEDKNPVKVEAKSPEKNALKNFSQDYLASRKKQYECDNCKMKFSRSVSLARHKCINLRDNHTEKSDIDLSEDSSKEVSNVHGLKRFNTGEKQYECVYKKKFSSLSTFNYHKLVNQDQKPYKCDVCEKRFCELKILKIHKRKQHTDERPYECNFCGKKFKKKCQLVVHERIHTGERPYKCEDCNEKFITSTKLLIHKQRAHVSEKPYKCDVCEKGFCESKVLKIHKRIHTGEKPYECDVDVCKKKFITSCALVVHKRTHTGEKPYKCEDCDEKFITSTKLMIHRRRTHTGEKPYKCDVCEKAFFISAALMRHKRTHTGERPYECDVCGKKYKQTDTLVKHKRTHTREKPL